MDTATEPKVQTPLADTPASHIRNVLAILVLNHEERRATAGHPDSCGVSLSFDDREAVMTRLYAAVDLLEARPSAELLQLAGDILTTAVEGGSNYWAVISGVERAEDLTVTRATFTESADDDVVGKVATIGQGEIIAALRLLASGTVKIANEYVGYAALGLVGRADGADGADVAVQVAVFGEVVYG